MSVEPVLQDGSSPLVQQLSALVSSLAPAVNQFFSSSGDSPGAISNGSGAFGVLYDMGRKVAGALSTSLASNEARETLWLPLHEQLGMMRDFLGLSADDARGVRSAARLLVVCQLPLLRFAAEREVCTDPEADRKALKLVSEYPTAKK